MNVLVQCETLEIRQSRLSATCRSVCRPKITCRFLNSPSRFDDGSEVESVFLEFVAVFGWVVCWGAVSPLSLWRCRGQLLSVRQLGRFNGRLNALLVSSVIGRTT